MGTIFFALIWTMGNHRCITHHDAILCFKFVMVAVAAFLLEHLDLLLQWSEGDEALTVLADYVVVQKVSYH